MDGIAQESVLASTGDYVPLLAVAILAIVCVAVIAFAIYRKRKAARMEVRGRHARR